MLPLIIAALLPLLLPLAFLLLCASRMADKHQKGGASPANKDEMPESPTADGKKNAATKEDEEEEDNSKSSARSSANKLMRNAKLLQVQKVDLRNAPKPPLPGEEEAELSGMDDNPSVSVDRKKPSKDKKAAKADKESRKGSKEKAKLESTKSKNGKSKKNKKEEQKSLGTARSTKKGGGAAKASTNDQSTTPDAQGE